MKDAKIVKKLGKMHTQLYDIYNAVKQSDRLFTDYERLLFAVNRADELVVQAYHEACRIGGERLKWFILSYRPKSMI